MVTRFSSARDREKEIVRGSPHRGWPFPGMGKELSALFPVAGQGPADKRVHSRKDRPLERPGEEGRSIRKLFLDITRYQTEVTGSATKFIKETIMKKILLVLFAFAFLVSCGASVNPLLKAKIDAYPTAPGAANFVTAKKIIEPMPYAVGQYVVYMTTEKKTNKSIFKTSIVGKEGAGWVFEYYTLSASQENVIQMLISGLDKIRKSGNPDDIEILWVKIRDDKGKIQKIDGPILSMTKGMYKKMLPDMKYNFTKSVDGGVVKVAAGSFTGTTKIHTTQKIMGKSFETDGWFHPAVPINGIVKSVTDSGDVVMELVKFGTRGAVAELK